MLAQHNKQVKHGGGQRCDEKEVETEAHYVLVFVAAGLWVCFWSYCCTVAGVPGGLVGYPRA